MQKGDRFKSVVSDHVFEVISIFEETFGTLYRFKLKSENVTVWVDEQGKNIANGLVFRLINPGEPLPPPLRLEVGKIYVDAVGSKWFIYHVEQSGNFNAVRVNSSAFALAFKPDGSCCYGLHYAENLVKEVKI